MTEMKPGVYGGQVSNGCEYGVRLVTCPVCEKHHLGRDGKCFGCGYGVAAVARATPQPTTEDRLRALETELARANGRIAELERKASAFGLQPLGAR